MTITNTFENYADAQPRQTVGGMLGTAGLTFLSNLVNAKKEGAELPKFLDKIATVAIGGEQKAVEIAKKEVQKETTNKMGWIIAGILVIVIIVLFVRSK